MSELPVLVCICPDDGSDCLGDPTRDYAPGETKCEACFALDAEAPCLNEPEGSA